LIFGDGSIEAYLGLAVDNEEIEILLEVGSQHLQIGEIIDSTAIDPFLEYAVEQLKVQVFSGLVLFDQIIDNLQGNFEIGVRKFIAL
jgi:hypothetical protein